MSPVPPVYALILAAGGSSRFGGDKLLADAGGRPVLTRVLDAVKEAEVRGVIRASWVVLSGPGSPVADLARLNGFRIIVAADASAGLARSLQAGIAQVEQSAPAGEAAALVVLGDQPSLRPEVIEQVIRRWRATGAAAVRPRYEEAPDEPGHPVLVSKRLWADVRQLEGDAGLGQVLARLPVAYVDVPGANPDIDTPRDLAQWGREDDD